MQHLDDVFQRILAAMQESVFVATNEGTILMANNTAAELLCGGAPEDVVGHKLQDYLIVRKEEELILLFGQVLKRTRPLRHEILVQLSQGPRWFHSTLQPVRFGPAGIHAILSIASDISEKKWAEEARSRTNERFRNLFEAMEQGVVYQDAQGRIFSANPAAERILGLRMEQLVAFESTIPPDGYVIQEDGSPYPVHELPSMVALRTGKVVLSRVMGVYNPERGEYRWLNADAVPLMRPGHTLPSEVFTSFEDITHRKLAEQQLQDKEQRYRLIFEKSPLGMIHFSDKGTIIDCNDKFVELMGSSRELLMGFDMASKSMPAMCAVLSRALAGKAAVFEGRYTSVTGGKSSWLRAIFNPVVPDKNPTEVIATLEDISERTLSELRLRSSENRFRTLVENLPMVAVQSCDIRGRIRYWNGASEKLYGYSSHQVLGESIQDLIVPEHRRLRLEREVELWLNNRSEMPEGEMEVLCKGGSLVPVYYSFAKQVTSDRGLEVFCIQVDLSPMKQAQKELVRAKRAAEAASKAKSEFLANMSHEIRTPLNGIMGMLQLISLFDLEKEHKEYCEIAIQSCKRLTRLLSDILDITRIESGRLEIRIEPFDFFDVMKSIQQLFEPAANQKGLRLQFYVHETLPQCMSGDAARLQQVLNNLVGNALKFTERGEILMEAYPLPCAAQDKVRVLFAVTDTGIGMEAGKVDLLFEAFTQGEGSYNRKYQGAGLGLSIVKHLVELMGGSISVVSEPGKGTSFHFCATFGRVSACPYDTRLLIEQKVPPEAALNIMLLEDDLVSRFSVSRMIELHGHNVIAAESPDQALELLRSRTVDLLIVGFQSCTGHCLDIVQRIRDEQDAHWWPKIPIVAVTACATAEDKDAILAAGLDGCLIKPVELEELLETLRQAMVRITVP